MKQVSSLIITIISLFLIISCEGNSMMMKRLNHIDNIMDKNPKAAMDSLIQMSDTTGVLCKQEIMKYRILCAKAQNLLCYEMPSDSAFKEIVDHYEIHGTDNERLLSQYLLGCIYRNQCEAPTAMLCYKKAVDYADTTDVKCDFITLYKVYKQMAEIYESQYLMDKAIEAYTNYCRYAQKTGYIKDFIYGKESIALIYFAKGDTLKSMKMMRHCLRLYKKYNMENASFRSIQSMADFYFLMNEFDSTNIYIKKIDNMYKRISHVKDMSSMNYFNYYKGKYYERINKLDSAEYYYRQLPSFGYGREGYSGLLRIYCEKQCQDSIKKYQNLYEKSIDENEKSNQAKALLQASAMYDYERLHKENSKSKYNATRIKYALWSLTATIIVVLYALYYGFRIYRKRRRNEKEELVKSIMMLKIKLKSKEDIINKMTLDGITMYKAQNEVNRLKASVKTYESNENYDTRDTLLLMERLSERFMLLSCPKPGSMRPDEDDWHCLEEFFLKKMIRLNELFHRSNLSQQELRVCMLTFIGVPSSSISVLINSSPQRITNIKTSSNMKIFGERNAKTLIQNLKKA